MTKTEPIMITFTKDLFFFSYFNSFLFRQFLPTKLGIIVFQINDIDRDNNNLFIESSKNDIFKKMLTFKNK